MRIQLSTDREYVVVLWRGNVMQFQELDTYATAIRHSTELSAQGMVELYYIRDGDMVRVTFRDGNISTAIIGKQCTIDCNDSFSGVLSL